MVLRGVYTFPGELMIILYIILFCFPL